MARRDRRVLGQTNTLLEQVVDFNRLRRERLAKVQREMQARDIGALVLTDTMNIRYCTGIAVMPLWTATNLAHYTLLPAQGEPAIFEYPLSQFRVEPFWPGVRPARYWQARFADELAPAKSDEWAAEIKDVLRQWGVADARIGIDCLDYYGFSGLQKQGLHLTDADLAIEAARILKTMDEIELMRQSATVAEAALYDMEQAIRPGITENELLAVFWHGMLALGGEHCFTRLLASGYKTNPWFHEAGSKMVRPGDLVGIDTDMIGPEGYACDISRTFLCGDAKAATPLQKEAYTVAHDFIQQTIELIKPGVSYHDFLERLPLLPEAYRAQQYSTVVHGIGTDDEPPFIPFPGGLWTLMPEGEFVENMVVSVECYAGKVGEQDGVKLEDEVWITADGPTVISLYPYEAKL
ncbi:MAG: Xaa-Pro peptidase family protein, partial [Chloroflexota bacterium]